LFGSLRQDKIGSCVAFVLEPRRKEDKQKLDCPQKRDCPFATQKHVVSFTFYLQAHLQLEIHPPWQMTAFRVSNSSGNGIIETGCFQLI
jgi:hypothetical protein